jgi:hypothetical protein
MLRLRATGKLLLPVLLLLASCGRSVTVTLPPRVDLHSLGSIGVIEFTSSPPGPVGEDATQKFLADLQAAQPGVPLLELGRPDQVLREVGAVEFNPEAVRALGQKYGLDTLVTGSVELGGVRPGVKIAPDLTSISAQGKIDARMNAKLWATASGATIWTNSSWGSWSVASLNLSDAGAPRIAYRDPRAQQDRILLELIRALNGGFWPTYETRRVQ